ncbi:MAG: choice-of-anchor M domain-containing protein [Verrucomicrobiota bacterium]
MKYASLFGLAAWAAGGTSFGLEPLPEHIDVVPEFTGGSWDWEIGTDSISMDPSSVFFPLRDFDFSSKDPETGDPLGERYFLSLGSGFDFLGFEEGEPVWILPQSDFNYTWPGMENAQSGVFHSYVETDPRASGLAQPWIRIYLDSVQGPGEFSLFQLQSGQQVIWMTTADGIGSDDLFLLLSPGHDHMWWGFTKKGVYRVNFRAQARLGADPTNLTPLSDPQELFFAVGARAEWRAMHFDSDDVMLESVAGDDADPDKDGKVSLLEYAFGTDPTSASMLHESLGVSSWPELVIVEDAGMSYPAMRFFRRINEDADVTYSVEWNSTLSPATWTSNEVEVDVEDFGERWERVTLRDTSPVSGKRFGRVKVETGS